MTRFALEDSKESQIFRNHGLKMFGFHTWYEQHLVSKAAQEASQLIDVAPSQVAHSGDATRLPCEDIQEPTLEDPFGDKPFNQREVSTTCDTHLNNQMLENWQGGEQYTGDVFPTHLSEVELGYLQATYRTIPEEFYRKTKLPVVTPDNLYAFLQAHRSLDITWVF